MMATALFGNVQEYDLEKEEWSQYAERLEHFFLANKVADAERKRAILLSVMGPACYRLLRNLVAPEKPSEKTYKELVDALKEHHELKPSEIVQRCKFNSRVRQSGESISMFVSQLRSLAEHCNFGPSLQAMLRDRLVCGINNPHMQQQLLAKKDLTFDSAFSLTLSLEAAAKNVQALQGAVAAVTETQSESTVHKVDTRAKQSQRFSSRGAPKRSGLCFRCGRGGHMVSKCRFKSATCHKCGKTGHIKAACRSKDQSQHQGVKTLLEESTDAAIAMDSMQEYKLFAVGSSDGRSPIEVELELDGHRIRMEIDTGASLSLVSEATFKQLWPGRTLEPSTVRLKTYTGEVLKVLGSAQVHVTCSKGQEADLPLIVLQTEGPSLLGRNWLQNLRLDWQQIHRLNNMLDEVLDRHSEVFREELGTLKGFKAKIHVDPSVTPRFCKARPVPYAMRELVEKELDHLTQQGVLEPVQFADWAAPIVPVLKSDKKSLRICGDFKMTVNAASRLDAYPIPRVEDLLAKLAGGKSYSKLDLSQAYQQLELDEDSKNYVVINTHKGLFRFNRLPFGVSSAPGIFQRTMESLLHDIPSVVVYLDDILITGRTDAEHIETLDKVLTRLEESGLRLKRSKCVFMAQSVVYLRRSQN